MIRTVTIYAAYDCRDAGGPAGDGSGERKLLGYFQTREDAEHVAENKGWRTWDLDGKHGDVEEIEILSDDNGQTGYTHVNGPWYKTNPPFKGDSSHYHLRCALDKLDQKEREALKKHAGKW